MAAAIPKTQTFYAEGRAEWRQWLSENHATSGGIWLIYYKKGSGKTRVAYDEAVEEALCFGWIDSTLNPIDELCYMQLFMPRKPRSGWSKLNKDRVERLTAQGLMTPAGMEKIIAAKQDGSWGALDHIESFSVPHELQREFDKHEAARLFFEGLSKTNKKYILYFINNAKSGALRAQRVAEIIAAANEGRMHERYIVPPAAKKKAKKKPGEGES